MFKSKELSLVQKRRLMRFLMFASGEFEVKPEVEGKEDVPFVNFLKEVFSIDEKSIEAIAYALAFCVSPAGKEAIMRQNYSRGRSEANVMFIN